MISARAVFPALESVLRAALRKSSSLICPRDFPQKTMINNKKIMPTVKNGGHKIRNDIILIISIAVIVPLLALCLYFFAEEGDNVKVTVDGLLFGEYSLDEDLTVDIITGESGEGLNRLVIQDGKAYVESANCPDGICSSHKPISREGESIICLPHKVVISVQTKKGSDSPAPDVIA